MPGLLASLFGGKEPDVRGTVSPGFEPVRDLFRDHFKRGLEEDAQVCAYVGEEKVVDLWCSSSGDPNYDGDSLTLLFSSTKSLTSIMVATLVDQGLITYGDKISDHWPEFARSGKEKVTVESVMKHEAGLARMDGMYKVGQSSIYRESIKRNELGRLAEEAPLQFPRPDSNTDRQYHALSRGLIMNELFRRVDKRGRTIGEALREDVAGPLKVDVLIGGITEEEDKRTVKLKTWSLPYVYFQEALPDVLGSKIERSTLGYAGGLYKTYKMARLRPYPFLEGKMGRLFEFDFWDKDTVKKGEIPSANGRASARGLARLAAAMANGGSLGGTQIMKRSTWELMHGGGTKKKDAGQNIPGLSPIIFTSGGLAYFDVFEDESEEAKAVRRLRKGYYGWYGLGGSVFQWHPEEKVGFSYVPTLMAWYDTLSLRGARLQAKVVECAKERRERAEGRQK